MRMASLLIRIAMSNFRDVPNSISAADLVDPQNNTTVYLDLRRRRQGLGHVTNPFLAALYYMIIHIAHAAVCPQLVDFECNTTALVDVVIDMVSCFFCCFFRLVWVAR